MSYLYNLRYYISFLLLPFINIYHDSRDFKTLDEEELEIEYSDREQRMYRLSFSSLFHKPYESFLKTPVVVIFINIIFIAEVLYYRVILFFLNFVMLKILYDVLSIDFKITNVNLTEFFSGIFDFLKKFLFQSISATICFIFFYFLLFLQGASLTKILALWFLGFGNIY